MMKMDYLYMLPWIEGIGGPSIIRVRMKMKDYCNNRWKI